MARKSSISRKVILSFTFVVLFQGLISIAAAIWIIVRTSNIALDAQVERTAPLVEKALAESAKNLAVKAELLAGQQKILDDLKSDNQEALGRELAFFLQPLDLGAILILDYQLSPVASVGNQELIRGILDNGILYSVGSDPKVFFNAVGNKLHLWACFPQFRQQNRDALLCVGIVCDRAFISHLEEYSNASLILSYRKATMIKGHMPDAVFLEYARRAYSDPSHAEEGRIDTLTYRLVRMTKFKDLSAVFFLDDGPTQNLVQLYTLSAALLLLVILGAGIAAAVFFYRATFLKPFQSFQTAIRRISSGDLTFRAQGEDEDEFGELEKEFELMTTNLKAVEKRLELSSRMAAVGEMVAGVAHQIRNPLGVMKVSNDLLKDYFTPDRDPGGQWKHVVTMVGHEIDALSDTISTFLDFTRPLHIRLKETDLGNLLDHAAQFAGERFPQNPLTVELDPRPLVFPLDPGLFHQVLSNLLINACEASSPGQAVSLRAVLQSEGLTLTVTDQGGGMDEEVLRHIFHPFFTTKPGGNGLGLSIVHRIVTAHQGQISCESRGGAGTRFILFFPYIRVKTP